MIPLVIKMMSWAYPVTDYQKEYPGDTTINESKGEIEYFTCRDCKGYPIGKQIVGMRDENYIDYDFIWRHLGGGYYKCTSKTRSWIR